MRRASCVVRRALLRCALCIMHDHRRAHWWLAPTQFAALFWEPADFGSVAAEAVRAMARAAAASAASAASAVAEGAVNDKSDGDRAVMAAAEAEAEAEAEALAAAAPPEVFRAKGLLRVEGCAHALSLQAVHNTYELGDGPMWDSSTEVQEGAIQSMVGVGEEAGGDGSASHFVFIGRHLHRRALNAALCACRVAVCGR